MWVARDEGLEGSGLPLRCEERMYLLRSKVEGDQLCFAFKKRGTSSEKVRFKFLFLIPVSSSIIRDSM